MTCPAATNLVCHFCHFSETMLTLCWCMISKHSWISFSCNLVKKKKNSLFDALSLILNSSWPIPVAGLDEEIVSARLCAPHLHGWGMNLSLRPGPAGPSYQEGPVNARSVANKTFILNDFFISFGLDFLCVTEICVGETWISTCCPNKPLIKNINNSFNLVQSVGGPTHEHGHRIDQSCHMVYLLFTL